MPRSKAVSVANWLSDGVCMDLQWDLETQHGVDWCAWERLRGLGPIRCINGMKIEVPHPPTADPPSETGRPDPRVRRGYYHKHDMRPEYRGGTQERDSTANTNCAGLSRAINDGCDFPARQRPAMDVFADVADWIFSAAFHATTRSLSSGLLHDSRRPRESTAPSSHQHVHACLL